IHGFAEDLHFIPRPSYRSRPINCTCLHPRHFLPHRSPRPRDRATPLTAAPFRTHPGKHAIRHQHHGVTPPLAIASMPDQLDSRLVIKNPPDRPPAKPEQFDQLLFPPGFFLRKYAGRLTHFSSPPRSISISSSSRSTNFAHRSLT